MISSTAPNRAGSRCLASTTSRITIFSSCAVCVFRNSVNTSGSSKLLDDEFVADVLAVDFTNPVLSSQRCNLLRLVPTETAPDWRDRFTRALSAANYAAAKDLATNLAEATRTAVFHQQRATQFLASCREKLKARTFVISALQLVRQTPAAVRRNEISQGAGGQILEPGFRVIIPVAKPRGSELTLSPDL